MRRELAITAVLLGAGSAALVGAWFVHHERTKSFVERPAASGEIGLVSVFAQRPLGPVRLQPGRRRELERPQDLSFQWSSTGAGPRFLRIELLHGTERTILDQQTLTAPAEALPLGYVLRLDEDLPDDVEVVVTLEAPHAAGFESRYPLRLRGSAKRALETATATPTPESR